jgi:spermidine synthase
VNLKTWSPLSTGSFTLRVLPILFFSSGASSLVFEAIFTRLLTYTFGNTAHAVSTVLAAFLGGLALGAFLFGRWVDRRPPSLWIYGGLELLVGVYCLFIPTLFALLTQTYVALYHHFHLGPMALTWVRLGLAAVVILVPSVLMGGTLPALARFVSSRRRDFEAEVSRLYGWNTVVWTHVLTFLIGNTVYAFVGGIYAANTLGAILGSVLTGFVVLPRWGSLASLRGSATANLVLGLVFALWLVPLRRTLRLVLVMVVASLAVLFWLGPGGWDARRMSRGSYVYFDNGWPIDRVLYLQEDIQGGLTSVVQVGPTRVMLSNGKFQGNNSGEMGAQIRFALIPILFTREFGKALVIGLRTGNTLRTVASFPFRQIDTIEIAPHIVDAARLWFEDVNARVFDRDPRVRLHVADGRNFLLLSREQYDRITIEISSIWISGEADLYNKEFYELCRARLKEHGVLQQWVQIHHMRTQDFLVILNTVARVFPHVAFFLGPE